MSQHEGTCMSLLICNYSAANVSKLSCGLDTARPKITRNGKKEQNKSPEMGKKGVETTPGPKTSNPDVRDVFLMWS